MLPVIRSLESRRKCIIESLERSSYEGGHSKQHSGYGVANTRRRSAVEDVPVPHILQTYAKVDEQFLNDLATSSIETFPIKRLFNICNTYANVWDNRRSNLSGKLVPEKQDGSGIPRGPFPYVDDRATVLSELTKSTILKTRHRVNASSHPSWALKVLRRRRRKSLMKYKKRSISQESTRELQARLLADKVARSRTLGE
jgi:hypothetical protein